MGEGSARGAAAFDLAVIGAGPAGLSGAVTAADAGCRVVVLDLGERPGGQYWRHPPPSLGAPPSGLHHGWATFTALRGRFDAHRRGGRIEHRPAHAVWQVQAAEAGFVVRATEGERDARARTVRARTVLVATGAHDRHVPFPGWTLPGVMAVGGVQALLKGNLATPGRRVLVAGTGPFLLSAADGLLRAGVEVAAVVEATPVRAYARQARTLIAVPEKLREGAGYARSLARHRVPYLTGRAVVRAEGTGRVSSVLVEAVDRDGRVRPGRSRRLECDTLAVGYGFVAQLELLLELGASSRLDAGGSLVVETDSDQRTSVEGVYAAGEPTGVGGADLAVAEGALAGAAIAARLGRTRPLTPPAQARARRERRRLRAFARTLTLTHPAPDGWRAWCEPGTLICRCEEVTVGEVHDAVALGARDPRAVKLLARTGMGWCQGRICGAAVAELTAALGGRPVSADDLRDLARRPLAQPVPLDVLAGEDGGAEAGKMSRSTERGASTIDRGEGAP